MRQRNVGTLRVSAIGLGCMGMSFAYGAPQEEAGLATIERALALGVTLLDTADVYGPGDERAARRRGDRRPPRRGRAGDEVRQRLARRRAAHQRSARVRALGVRGQPAATRRRRHRPVLPAPRRPEHADRGDGRRDGRARRARARSATSACPRRPRTRSAARTPCTRSPRCRPSTRCGRATSRRRSCRRSRELGIGLVAYSPLGRGFLTGTINSHRGPRRGRLAPRQYPRFQQLDANRRIVDAVRELAARARGDAGAGRARLAARAGRGHRADPRDDQAASRRGERRRGRPASRADELARLDAAAPLGAAVGDRYPTPMMSSLNG